MNHRGTSARALWVIPGLYLLFVTGEFLTMTHVALDLTTRGHSALVVGVMASTMWVGIMASSMVAHRMIARLGPARALMASAVVSCAALACMIPHDHVGAWMVSVFVIGAAGGLMWVGGESWLAEAAPRARRGVYVGLFETSVGVGMLLGPALWPVARTLGWPALGLALALLALGCLCSVLLRPLHRPQLEPDDGPSPVTQRHGAPSAPDWYALAAPLAAVVATSGLLESGSSALLPSVSVRLGFDVRSAALLGAVIGAGSALMQAPFGLLADRVGMPRAMTWAWAALVAVAVVLLVQASDPGAWMWIAGFVLGGVGGAIYTLVVIELGHALAGAPLVRAMSLLVTAYTAGTSVGPALGGALFDAGGMPALGAGLLACSVGGALLTRRALRLGAARRPGTG